jgi:hypothetical protein
MGWAGWLVDQKVKFLIWVYPQADNGTPLCSALAQAKTILQTWLSQHPACFPPIVIHMTDGESTDGDPSEAMNGISSLCSSDGNCLLFNLHLSSNAQAQPVVFPDSGAGLPDQYAKLLFDRASALTANMRSEARARYALNVSEGARGFVLNADIEAIIMALDIGTRPSNLR